MKLRNSDIRELAPAFRMAANAPVHYPSYGKYLEDFEENAVYEHPRGITLSPGLLHDFAMTYLEANPLYLNVEYAKSLGHPSIPASPLLVFNIALSLGVQNNSEKAYANLGYYNMQFLRSAYAGDTLRSVTRIAEKKDRGAGKPGIVTLNTVCLNQRGEVLLRYTRKIMVPPRPAGYQPPEFRKSDFVMPEFSSTEEFEIPDFSPADVPVNLTLRNTLYDNFEPGAVIASPNGRTITDEHYAWTYKVGNTHPLHFDRMYSQDQTGAMSGDPIVYGGLVFAWLHGLAGRDISENAIWDGGYTEGYHTQPVKSGDTIYVIHRVLSRDEVIPQVDAGMIQFQMIGLKNLKPWAALEKYGADLFIKENDKKDLNKEKIGEKIFEIERKLLIRAR